jgi:hypothetical protein
MSTILPDRIQADADAVTGLEKISVIMIVSERPEPLDLLYEEYVSALRAAGYASFEFIVVATRDDRRLVSPLLRLAREGEPVRVLESAHNVGEATLLRSAFAHCAGSIVAVVPAYRRIEASGLPLMIRRVEEGAADLVVACRSQDADSWSSQLQRRVVHGLVRRAVGGSFHDLGSGIRVMRAEVIREVPMYGEFLRFLPLLAVREGFTTEEVPVLQHPADRRPRFYSPGTYLRRLIDLAGVFFLVRFREKPLRFFGLFGSSLALVGGVMLAIMFVQRLMGQGLAERPLLLLAVLLTVIGLQAIALGLVGEIIVHASARHTPNYRLARYPDHESLTGSGTQESAP